MSTVHRLASMEVPAALALLNTTAAGLSGADAAERLIAVGQNALRVHRARPWRVLGRQLKSPILILLFVTAGVSVFLGEATNSIIIGVILVASIGLGFVNEFRAERAGDALHDQVRHTVLVMRDSALAEVDVTALVPGDIVHLSIGSVVAADIRLISCHELSCDEGILTGESLPVEKSSVPSAPDAAIGDLSSCVLMGTVIQSGSAVGLVVETGPRTEFGRIATGLGTQQPQTEFQRGLSAFSLLLLEVAVALTSVIFVANLLLQRPVIDSLLFSLAIAVGITPQLLPAVVSASLAAGSRALTKKSVLVKRLICIEDLGNMDMLVTDKTGTLTEGRITFTAAIPIDSGTSVSHLHLLALLATESERAEGHMVTLGLNPLDAALWNAPASASMHPERYNQLEVLPFDHNRRMTSVLVDDPSGRRFIITKGSPEEVLLKCSRVPGSARSTLDIEYSKGARVVAVAHKFAPDQHGIGAGDEAGLTLDGFLVFLDPPKADAASSLAKLAQLGITVKIATGDSAIVAEKVLSDLGILSAGTLSGNDIDALSDDDLKHSAASATIFARVSPEQKARIIR
ncbi:HAD-IC family P-type ATPase, partial [Salinibacterium sp.]|uniref:cation-translocating P-type ATPase n=1 Tax=Salinibacterium sp. TaxID=1915057 RepID=UPI00286C2F22